MKKLGCTLCILVCFIFQLTPHTSHHTPHTSLPHYTPFPLISHFSPHTFQPGRDSSQPGRDSSQRGRDSGQRLQPGTLPRLCGCSRSQVPGPRASPSSQVQRPRFQVLVRGQRFHVPVPGLRAQFLVQDPGRASQVLGLSSQGSGPRFQGPLKKWS